MRNRRAKLAIPTLLALYYAHTWEGMTVIDMQARVHNILVVAVVFWRDIKRRDNGAREDIEMKHLKSGKVRLLMSGKFTERPGVKPTENNI